MKVVWNEKDRCRASLISAPKISFHPSLQTQEQDVLSEQNGFKVHQPSISVSKQHNNFELQAQMKKIYSGLGSFAIILATTLAEREHSAMPGSVCRYPSPPPPPSGHIISPTQNGPLQRKTAIWVIFSKVVFFALLNGSWFQLHAREILESYEIALLSKFRGKVGYVQDFDQKRRSAAASGRS